MSNTTKKLAVIIAAYKAEKFIMETVKSLKNQKVPEGWEVKFFIGVDGCENTSRVLKENKVPFYFSEKNVGTYVMANSLIHEAKKIDCDMFLRFDADDVAKENFIFNGINNCLKSGFYITYFIQADVNLKIINKKQIRAHGIVLFTKEVLNKFGGYRNYRVSCDQDLIFRLRNFGYINNIDKNRSIFIRRVHTNSLTNTKKTCIGSNYRNNVWKKLCDDRLENMAVKNPVKTDLKYIS